SPAASAMNPAKVCSRAVGGRLNLRCWDRPPFSCRSDLSETRQRIPLPSQEALNQSLNEWPMACISSVREEQTMVHLTESAANAVRSAIAGAPEPMNGLRIMVEAGGCSGFQYKMGLVAEPS